MILAMIELDGAITEAEAREWAEAVVDPCKWNPAVQVRLMSVKDVGKDPRVTLTTVAEEPMEDGEYFPGLYEVKIGDEPATRVVRMRSAREGAMREFMHVERDEYLGCAGVNWAKDNVRGPL